MILNEITDILFRKLLNGKIPVGDSKKLGGKGASEYLNKTSIGAIGQAYRVFARMDATLNNEPETILISGGGGFSNEDGLWAVCFYARPSSNQAFIIRELIPPKTGEVKFGWYTDGNYRYFGMYTSYPYSSVPFIVKLDGKSEDGTYNAEYGGFYNSATMPTGWAEVTTYKFATDADLANYALISQLFSKVKDYANLNFDTALTTSIFSSTAPPNNVGATNYPVNATGILVVFSNGGSSVTQQYFTYTGELWRRSYFTGMGWTKWDRDTTTADLANYLPKTGGTVDGIIQARVADYYPLRAIRTDDDKCYTAYSGLSGALGRLGFYAVNKPAYMSTEGVAYDILHSGNVGEYALPISGGGTVTSSEASPIKVNCTNENAQSVMQEFYKLGTLLGKLGVSANGPVYRNSNNIEYALHHDGNSAKVILSETPLTAEGSIRVW